MNAPKKGDEVSWKYGKSEAEGTVTEVHKSDIKRNVQGTTVKRKGSAKEPSLVIKQGSKRIVKSSSEVTKK